MSGELLYLAPGAGLGHLCRAAAISRHLGERGVPARVVTDSPFAEGVASLAGCRITRLASARWAREVPRLVAEAAPGLLVLDTFPAGLRGEWQAGYPAGCAVALVARRLRLGPYLEAFPGCPRPARVLLAEEPGEELGAWLAAGGAEVVGLPGRVRLPHDLPGAEVDPALGRRLEGGEVGLVVHSGPPAEVDRLMARAAEEASRRGVEDLALVSPVPMTRRGVASAEAFPAASLFPRAAFVVTGGGYNSVAEARALARYFVAVPLPRRWDDQEARVADRITGVEDGGPRAGEVLAAWWGEATRRRAVC